VTKRIANNEKKLANKLDLMTNDDESISDDMSIMEVKKKILGKLDSIDDVILHKKM
jgi:hypothetical protein